MALSTNIAITDGVLLISLKGKVLEDSFLKDLLKQVEKDIEKTKGKAVMNLTDLDYINSTGINFFIKVLTKTRVHGGDLVFYGISGSVKTIVQIAKMDEVFTIVQSYEDALEIFKSTK